MTGREQTPDEGITTQPHSSSPQEYLFSLNKLGLTTLVGVVAQQVKSPLGIPTSSIKELGQVLSLVLAIQLLAGSGGSSAWVPVST